MKTKGDGNNLPNIGNLSGEALFEEIGKFIVDKLPEPNNGGEQNDVFNSLENGVVLAALKRTNGNKQAAANLLGFFRRGYVVLSFRKVAGDRDRED